MIVFLVGSMIYSIPVADPQQQGDSSGNWTWNGTAWGKWTFNSGVYGFFSPAAQQPAPS